MANVAVYNMEGRKLRHVLKFAVAEENHGDRREQDMHVRVLQDLHSGQVVELYSLLLLEITHSSSTRKRREQLLSLHLHQELLRTSSL